MNIAENRTKRSLLVSAIDAVHQNNRHGTIIEHVLTLLQEDDPQKHTFYLNTAFLDPTTNKYERLFSISE